MVVASDELSPGIQRQFPIVQTGESFAIAGLAQTETAGLHRFAGDSLQCIGIEGMQGLTLLQHHHIGDVHHGIDAVDPGAAEPTLHPGR